MGRGATEAGIDMTGEGMTSVSVSYEIRRQLNTLRTTGGHRSVNELLAEMIRTHKMLKMKGKLHPSRTDEDGRGRRCRTSCRTPQHGALPGVMLHDVVAPSRHRFGAKDLVKALCSDETHQSKLLMQCAGKVELLLIPRRERLPVAGHEHL